MARTVPPPANGVSEPAAPAGRLAAWRASRLTQLQLPSGLVVTVKKIAILDLAERGSIPTPLLGRVQAFVDASSGSTLALDVAKFHEYAPVIDLVVAAALIDPPIVEVGDDEHIALSELPIADRLEIFNWAQQEGAPLAPFPGQS